MFIKDEAKCEAKKHLKTLKTNTIITLKATPCKVDKKMYLQILTKIINLIIQLIMYLIRLKILILNLFYSGYN